MNLLDFNTLERQDYIEYPTIDDKRIKNYDCFQPKCDGIWAKLLVRAGESAGLLVSRTGKTEVPLPVPQSMQLSQDYILVGEYMASTQWAQAENRKGRFYAFDLLDASLMNVSYERRYQALVVLLENNKDFVAVPTYPLDCLRAFWKTLVDIDDKNAFEGVVLRNTQDLWGNCIGKVKNEIEDDCIIVGYQEGRGKYAGTLGALVVSYFNASPGWQMTVSGLNDTGRRMFWSDKETYLNRVVTLKGKARFASGKLRHPQFVGLHPDKLPEQCLAPSN